MRVQDVISFALLLIGCTEKMRVQDVISFALLLIGCTKFLRRSPSVVIANDHVLTFDGHLNAALFVSTVFQSCSARLLPHFSRPIMTTKGPVPTEKDGVYVRENSSQIGKHVNVGRFLSQSTPRDLRKGKNSKRQLSNLSTLVIRPLSIV